MTDQANPSYSLVLVRTTIRPSGSVAVESMPGPRCDRCRHWYKRFAREQTTKRPCLAIDMPSGTALVQTSADFGCVLYEPKEGT